MSCSSGPNIVTNGLILDSSCILISSTLKPEDIEILNTINESELNNLLEQPFWKQPCMNCD